ncbi:MAG: flagellar basal body P-ring formation protein FlgA [Alphaproteobacteria bacterium]|nr:flagellar basal body P-ring formation protein FlgA [Alphaproteobacteria bacterium]
MRLLLILALGALIYTFATPAGATTLKPGATLDADTVRLSDIFDGVGPESDAIVLRAPAPGRRYVLDAAWLQETARVHGLGWRPVSRFDRIVVERIGRIIPAAEIATALREAIQREGGAEAMQLDFAGRAPEMAIAIQAPPTLDIQSLSYDRTSGRFSALLVAGASHPSAQRIAVSGRAVPTRPVPVLRRPMQSGEIIRAADVQLVEMRSDTLKRDVVGDAEGLIGRSARRSLRGGEPVRENDIRPPILVARNSLIVITLRAGSMSLSAQGRAIDEGSRGDMVRVMNLQTRKTIEGQVVGPDTVAVPLFAATN